jgi:hypothetical protein
MKKLFILILLLMSICCLVTTPVYAEAVQPVEIEVESNVYESSSSDDAWIPDGTSIIVTLLVCGATGVGLVISHNKANRQISATNYVAENGYKVNNRQEQYVKTYTTVQHNFYGSDKK